MSLIDDAIQVQNQSTAALAENDDTVTLTESELAAIKELWQAELEVAFIECLAIEALQLIEESKHE